jgi:membrane protease subunit HflK
MKWNRCVVICGVGLVACYVASGLAIVQPDEVGIVRRLGAVVPSPWEPGLHWGLPWGIDRVDRIKLRQVKSLSVGAAIRQEAPLAAAPDAMTDDFLTGDLNLVTAEARVQYRVRDPVAYLFRARDVEASLSALSRSALLRALAGRGIDELLTTGRAALALELAGAIERLADEEQLGVSILALRLGRLAPPDAVAPAFADAARARSDRRQAVIRAQEHRERTLALARAHARELADAAAGGYQRIVEPARGEAERFTMVAAEARKSSGAFEHRLFLETLGEILPRFRRTVVVAPGQDLDVSVLLGGEPDRTNIK